MIVIANRVPLSDTPPCQTIRLCSYFVTRRSRIPLKLRGLQRPGRRLLIPHSVRNLMAIIHLFAHHSYNSLREIAGTEFWRRQSRNTRAGSVRAARHAGNRQAETAVAVITTSADPNR